MKQNIITDEYKIIIRHETIKEKKKFEIDLLKLLHNYSSNASIIPITRPLDLDEKEFLKLTFIEN